MMGMHKLFNDDYSGPLSVKERPILMSKPMVRGVLKGWKTETRRIAKFKARDYANLQGYGLEVGYYMTGQPDSGFVLRSRDGGVFNDKTFPLECPYGKVGDQLWVRETFAPRFEGFGPKVDKNPRYVKFRADLPEGESPNDPDDWHRWPDKWKPSIFMPRWACRIILEITEVRVERLQDISEADAIAEGLEIIEYKGRPAYRYHGGNPTGHGSAKGAYWALWESINGKGSWESNPWVWVVKFKRIKESI